MRTGPLQLAVCLVLSSGLALAQAPAEKPKPGPEHKRLGGKMTSHDTCEWFEGGFAVLCRSDGKGPMGPTKALGILGYSTEEKAYTYYAVENGPMAMASVPRGTVDGGTWVYNDEAKMGGKTVKSRYTINTTSPTSYTFKWETQGEDGAWQTMMEGKSTKAS